MYDFRYSFIKKNFDAELLFIDRQSYLLNKIRRCLWRIFYAQTFFGFSNYPKDSKRFYLTNKKAIGKMKEDFEGKIVDELVGLNSMMYLFY